MRVNHNRAVIRKDGQVIAKLANYPLVPDEVEQRFNIEAVELGALSDTSIDRSGLSNNDLELINTVQPLDTE